MDEDASHRRAQYLASQVSTEELECYKRAFSEEDILARPVHKQTPEDFQERLAHIMEQDDKILKRLSDLD